MNQKLQEIGRKMGVTEKDIRDMGKRGFTGRIRYWIIAAIIAIISFILGFFIGQSTCPPTGGGGGYPFSAVLTPVALAGEKRSSRIAVLLMSATAFLIAIKAAPVFGQAIEYNVYSRN